MRAWRSNEDPARIGPAPGVLGAMGLAGQDDRACAGGRPACARGGHSSGHAHSSSFRRCRSVVMTPALAPVSISSRLTHSCRGCATQPILGAMDLVADHSDGDSPRCSCTMRTARSRTSNENLFVLFMAHSHQRVEPPQEPGRFSSFRPARRLWARTRNGHHLPNPAILLRKGEDWRPAYEVMKLDWIDQGTGTDSAYSTQAALVVTRLNDRLARNWGDSSESR